LPIFQPGKSDFWLGPNPPDFRNKMKIQTARFLLWFQSRIYVEGFWFFFLFHIYLVGSHKWLNHLVDGCQFSYITKLK
jgi:hypothetical protein